MSHARLLRVSALWLTLILINMGVCSIRMQSLACFRTMAPCLVFPFMMGALCAHSWRVRRGAILPHNESDVYDGAIVDDRSALELFDRAAASSPAKLDDSFGLTGEWYDERAGLGLKLTKPVRGQAVVTV